MTLLTAKPYGGQETSIKTFQSLRQRISEVLTAKRGKLWGAKRKTASDQEAKEAQHAPENDSQILNDGDDEEEHDENKPHPRCDWKTIDAIPASRYEELVSRTCTFSGQLKESRRLAYKKGTYNAVSFVGVMTRGKIDRYIVRVPGHATLAHWKAQDTYMMQREIEIIEHIRQGTSAPVPQICTYSTDFANVLGHPFIMMTMLPGRSACSAWFDEYWEESDEDFRFGDIPSPSVEKKRVTLLRSLARVMAEIATLSFDGTGAPVIPIDGLVPPAIGPIYQWDNTGSDIFKEHLPCCSTQDYVSERPNICSSEPDMQLGIFKLLDIVFSQSVFNPSRCFETFTLHHTDLDLQNILVDDEGNISGIIDWDRCLAVPRCIGAASAPLFLQKDWMPSYLNNLATSPYMAFDTHRYRQVYAAALAEQGCEDAKYATKSAMYQAGMTALNHTDGDVLDFLAKVLRSIPQFRANVDESLLAFGKGWPAGEQIVRRELKKMFEPDMPDMEVLREADAGIAATDWMIGFEYETS